jgi:2,3,4,5-tetrahydropyridine-2-carboxylate N-succinyltransferase
MDAKQHLQTSIDAAWEAREGINSGTKGQIREAVEEALNGLDNGTLRVCEKGPGGWVVNQWLKKAVLLSFRLYDSVPMEGGAVFPKRGGAPWFDKVPLKTTGWDAKRFAKANFRSVPGSVIRRGSYVAPSVVVMPSFINLGAYVDSGSMVDTWATVGSCAQIGKNCHLSGGVGIGGVLEPLQANPVIIEDNCFIGARSEVVEGVIVGTGAVLSMGVFISATTKVVDRATGQIHVGKVPAYSVVVPGNIGGGPDRPSTYCAVIVKTVDERTRSKTSINELLRD